MNAESSRETFLGGLVTALKDALLITAVCGAVGLLVNLFHPEKIPYIADEEYETLVPCPEPGGEVTPLEPSDPALVAKETFVVDARTEDQHAEWSFRGAMNVPYDYLDPTPDEVIQELAKKIAKSRAQRVAVYGDGDRPDTGEQLGKEISGKGIKNVFFVKGGAPALKGPEQPGGER